MAGVEPGAGGRVKAVVVSARGVAELTEMPVPEPGPGQVRVRVEGCGVCGSDVPVWEGRPWFEYPREAGAPGHEAWGRVDAVGPSVRSINPGTRVAGLSYRSYAEHDLAAVEQLVELPPALDDRPFPGEALGCAVNVFRRAAISPSDRVAVVGIGFLGALLVQLTSATGAVVVGVSRRQDSLDSARAMGASEVATLYDPPEPEQFDVVIEAAGRQETLDVAARLVKVRGRLVVAGFHQDEPRTVDLQSWNWRGIDVINAHERDPAVYVDGIRLAARLTASGQLEPDRLYTHRFPLEQAADALEAASARPEGFMKALVLA